MSQAGDGKAQLLLVGAEIENEIGRSHYHSTSVILNQIGPSMSLSRQCRCAEEQENEREAISGHSSPRIERLEGHVPNTGRQFERDKRMRVIRGLGMGLGQIKTRCAAAGRRD